MKREVQGLFWMKAVGKNRELMHGLLRIEGTMGSGSRQGTR